ncbi:MAG: tetratricopeptide repeat protein, partial [Sedimentisphaerales bacterium]|nr:tetratricopeptide repeat protein [Sedimentisphaerales bacterium]
KLTPYLSALCNYLTGAIDVSRTLIQKAINLHPGDGYCSNLEDEIEGRIKYGVEHFFDSNDVSIGHFLKVEASRESPPGEAALCYGASETIRTREIQYFQAAVQQTQNNVNEDFVELVTGFLTWKMGDSDKALPHLQKAVKLERSTQNVMCLARVYREMPDRKSEARQLYDSVLKESPDEFEAMWSLGMLADDSEKALGYYREASKVRSTDWRIHLSIGQTLAEMGRYSEAIEAYNSARYYCGENPSDISLSTAKAYIHLDKRDLAISYAEQACHEDPTSQKAKDLYASIKEVN